MVCNEGDDVTRGSNWADATQDMLVWSNQNCTSLRESTLRIVQFPVTVRRELEVDVCTPQHEAGTQFLLQSLFAFFKPLDPSCSTWYNKRKCACIRQVECGIALGLDLLIRKLFHIRCVDGLVRDLPLVIRFRELDPSMWQPGAGLELWRKVGSIRRWLCIPVHIPNVNLELK